MENLWPQVLAAIEKRVNPNTFNNWFTQVSLLQIEGDTVYLGLPNRFSRDWFLDHGLKDVIQQEFSSACSREMRVMLQLVESADTGIEQQVTPPEPAATAHDDIVAAAVRDSGLNPKYRFQDFVVGPSNQLAFAASMNVAENPANTYNPLFLYGGAGLGKTHLLNAIGHQMLKDRPTARIIYSSTETFVNEMINSIRQDKMEEFRNKYRSQADALLIDDIQFLSKKVRTQEEFFHTFNTLFESHRQIVISSDSYPQEIPELEVRLRTRFQWGLIADIQPPEIETRIAILQKKAELEGLDIPEDVCMFVATGATSNVREIEGSLKRLGAFASMYGKPITLEFAKDVLRDTLGTNTRLSIEDVIKAVSSLFNVKSSDLKGPRRMRSISRPRQIAMYICRSFLDMTLPEIGRHLNKDHSTVIAAVRKIESLLLTDPATRSGVDAIKRQLGL